jgi:hypothetical protein
MKTISALLKWLFGKEPKSPTPPAKKRYVCGWQRAHNAGLRRRDPDRMRDEDDTRRATTLNALLRPT